MVQQKDIYCCVVILIPSATPPLMFPDITLQYFLNRELSLGLQVIKVILLNFKKTLYNSYFEMKQEFSEEMIFFFFKFLLLVNKYFLNFFFFEK